MDLRFTPEPAIGKGITMDQVWAKPWERSSRGGELPAEFTLPSRVAALEVLVPVLRSQTGPVLITGDAGVGKTWLRRRLQTELPAAWRVIAVDPSSACGVAEFYRLVGHPLGLPRALDLGSARVELADFLKESAADGVFWVLAVDEAHGLSNEVLEEVRLLSNRLGEADGFAGLILLGQTALARRLAMRQLASLAARITARAHLRSLDIEETRALLEPIVPSLAVNADALEFLHREARGNPRRLLDSARFQRSKPAVSSSAPASLPPRETPPKAVEPAPQLPRRAPAAIVETRADEPWEGPVLGETKPPLRVEDGLIEVGWEPDSESFSAEGDESMAQSGESERSDAALALEPEAIQDRYAALQAWNEWARNQGRSANADPRTDLGEWHPPMPAQAATDPELSDSAGPEDSPIPAGVWAEGQHDFAPYGQLFTRLKNRRDSSSTD